jgi:hypothetical protein
VVLLQCYFSVTLMLHSILLPWWCYNDDTVLSQCCYSVLVLQCCNVFTVLQSCYSFAACFFECNDRKTPNETDLIAVLRFDDVAHKKDEQ